MLRSGPQTSTLRSPLLLLLLFVLDRHIGVVIAVIVVIDLLLLRSGPKTNTLRSPLLLLLLFVLDGHIGVVIAVIVVIAMVVIVIGIWASDQHIEVPINCL